MNEDERDGFWRGSTAGVGIMSFLNATDFTFLIEMEPFERAREVFDDAVDAVGSKESAADDTDDTEDELGFLRIPGRFATGIGGGVEARFRERRETETERERRFRRDGVFSTEIAAVFVVTSPSETDLFIAGRRPRSCELEVSLLCCQKLILLRSIFGESERDLRTGVGDIVRRFRSFSAFLSSFIFCSLAA